MQEKIVGISSVLEELYSSDKHIISVVLVDDVGLLLFSAGLAKDDPKELVMGPISHAIFSGNMEQGKRAKMKRMDFLSLEFSKGFILIKPCFKDHIISVAVDKNANIGLIRLKLSQAVEKVNKILMERPKAPVKPETVEKDIKDAL
ncbi:MAG: hypothetical protein ACETVN_06100, partial [Asgard group archaeon]